MVYGSLRIAASSNRYGRQINGSSRRRPALIQAVR
jgi:hypothetical protein